MTTLYSNPNTKLSPQHSSTKDDTPIEEINGLIKVFRNGQIQRLNAIPNVSSNVSSEVNVIAKDVVINKTTNLWIRIYVPTPTPNPTITKTKYPFVVYFHGGGFCIGSPSWICYHNFLSKLASIANCVIMSVNYRLAPENRLPTAYEDGLSTLKWIDHQIKNTNLSGEHYWWINKSNFDHAFISGDSAGANIAYNVTLRSLEVNFISSIRLKGIILIQPFFGGDIRTWSEKFITQPSDSALSLSDSDTYWRLSLPIGMNKNHPWCNPNVKDDRLTLSKLDGVMVCVSEMDILRDRNIEFCNGLGNIIRVEKMVYKGVGHAFQILCNSQLSHSRTLEMLSHLKAFINR